MTETYRLEFGCAALSSRPDAEPGVLKVYTRVSPQDATAAILSLLEQGLDSDPILDYIQREEW